MRPARPRPADEHGAFMILWALMLTGLLTMVAIVIDLGHLRETRATTQSVADMAALAAGEKLASVHTPEPQEGCRDAVAFIRMNTGDMPSGFSVPCGDLPPACDAGTTRGVVDDGGTAHPYRVEIVFPVPDADIADSRTATGVRTEDGEQCERMLVKVERTAQAFFSGVVGQDRLVTSASAVVRRKPPEANRIPNLWLLDPTGCNALSTQGGASLAVGTLTKSGLITLDSDGSSCGNSAYTIDAGGGSLVQVLPLDSSTLPDPNDPPGEISLVAMHPGQEACTTNPALGNVKACNPSQVGSSLNIWPQPTRREQRATRALVDHRYNCRYGQPSPHYADYPAGMASTVPRIPITDCTNSSGKAFIDQLRLGIGPSGHPAGFQRWREHFTCNNPTVPAELPGNWWIDCPGGLSIGSGTVNFTGGNIVFDGTLTMNGGKLRINSGAVTLPVPDPLGLTPPLTTVLDRVLPSHCLASVTGCLTESSPDAAFVYFRNGNIRFSSNPELEVTRAAVIQDGGYLRMNGQAPPKWSAPLKGPFAGLSLWSELADSTNYIINGGSGMELEGVFFTPGATFTINGGGGLNPQKAQFISYRLKLAGSGTLILEPDGLNQISLPPPVAALIR